MTPAEELRGMLWHAPASQVLAVIRAHVAAGADLWDVPTDPWLHTADTQILGQPIPTGTVYQTRRLLGIRRRPVCHTADPRQRRYW